MLYCLSPSRHVVPVVAVIQPSVGEWLSLVEHLVRDQGVGGSNPLSPTNLFNKINCIFWFTVTLPLVDAAAKSRRVAIHGGFSTRFLRRLPGNRSNLLAAY